MFLRFGHFEVIPGGLEALRQLYVQDCAPIVRRAPGSLDAYLLEPADGVSQVAVCTVWRTEADAQLYEASGAAAQVVAKVRHLFSGPPTLRSYRVVR